MSTPAAVKKPSFREQQLAVREDAILDAVNLLLASKSYDLMTMDDVAREVGIAKASLYKHFTSKDQLAAAAMTRLLHRALDLLRATPEDLAPRERLERVLRWGIALHLVGQMPILPTTRPGIREALVAHLPYAEALAAVTGTLAEWIVAAQGDGSLTTALPTEVVLISMLSRARDPAAEFLKLSERYDDATIVDYLVTACFDGLVPRPAPSRRAAK